MTQRQEQYGQYSDPSQQGFYESGLRIEDQSEAPGAGWGTGSGYNPPPAAAAPQYHQQQQQQWTSAATESGPSNTYYSAPPVQPMYSNPPQG